MLRIVLRMARASKRGGRAIRAWRTSQDPKVTQDALGEAVGVSGSAIRHFERRGSAFPLAISVKVKLSRRTGIRLEELVDAEELELARELVAVMARDAAA